MKHLLSDLRYAMRLFRKSPGFTIAAVFTLALGMGANTIMFSVLNTVLLRPLPYPHANRLVQIWETFARRGELSSPVSPYNFLEWRKQSRNFDAIAAYSYEPMVLTGLKVPVRVSGQLVSADFFKVFQVSAVKGRTFYPDEDVPGKQRFAVLSYAAWSRYFDRTPEIIGKPITLDDQSYTVIGIAPADFNFPDEGVEVWCTPGFAVNRVSRGSHFLFSIGRLKQDARLEQAQAELNTVAEDLNKQDGANSGVRLVGLQDEIVGSIRARLLVLWAAVLTVLLIACANVAGLLLARAVSRQREVAIRTALGGSRRRLLQQFLTESLLLAITGGALGVMLSYSAGRLLISMSNGAVPRLNHLQIDGWVLGFTACACIATGLIFGIAPSLHALRVDLTGSLKANGSDSSAAGRLRLRSLLVASELALALVLLVSGGLLTKSLWRLQHTDVGFLVDNLLTFRFNVPQTRYPDANRRREVYERVAERLSAVPGVESVGATTGLPFAGSRTSGSFAIIGRPADPSVVLHADYRKVNPGYFSAMRMRLLQGREFTLHDNQDGALVTIVNQAFAKKFLPNEDPLGHHLKAPAQDYEIIGVVADVKHENLAAPGIPEIYLSYLQAPDLKTSMFFVVRSHFPVQELAASVRNAVKEIAPGEPIERVTTMSQLVDYWISPQRFSGVLLGVFASLALLLAAIGIYGLVAYSVVQRTREIGIRMALGANKRDVLRLLFRQGTQICLAGMAIGIALTYFTTRALASILFGVDPHDPLIFAGVAVSLAAVVLAAVYIPARKATLVDPLVALRCE